MIYTCLLYTSAYIQFSEIQLSGEVCKTVYLGISDKSLMHELHKEGYSCIGLAVCVASVNVSVDVNKKLTNLLQDNISVEKNAHQHTCE